jgi:hypothetical protein
MTEEELELLCTEEELELLCAEEELELLCAEEEIYVQSWRSNLTQEQLKELNK